MTQEMKEYVRGVYRDMLNHYYENMGKQSKYAGELITPKMIANLTRRYLELGGTLTCEPNEVNWEEIEAV